MSYFERTHAHQGLDVDGSTLIPAQAPGMITMYGGSTAPSGFLLCDGSAVSRTTYAALFAVCGTTFGAGDSSTTFNVPDMRGVFPKGAGTTNRTLGKDANGNYYAGTLGTYLTDKMQGHFHPFEMKTGGASAGRFSGTTTDATTTWSETFPNTVRAGAPKTDGTNGTPRTGMTTEPQSLGLTFIIKT